VFKNVTLTSEASI